MEAINYSDMPGATDGVPMPIVAEQVRQEPVIEEVNLYAGNAVEAPARNKRPRTQAQMDAFERARNIRYKRCAEARAKREAEKEAAEKAEAAAAVPETQPAPAPEPARAPETQAEPQAEPALETAQPRKTKDKKSRATRREREEREWQMEKQRIQELLNPLLPTYTSKKKKKRKQPRPEAKGELEQYRAPAPEPPASLTQPVKTVHLSAGDIMRHYGF